MTLAEYETAFEARALACGFTKPQPAWRNYRSPGGCVLTLEHCGFAIDRERWAYQARWHFVGFSRADIGALHALDIATSDLPSRYGFSAVETPVGYIHPPAGYGTGAENDTRGT